MADAHQVVECLDTAAITRLTGVNRSTLDYWVRTGLVSPSLRAEPGRRRTRLWSLQDAVVVRAIARLRAAGCPLQSVRRARVQIERAWSEMGADATLLWDGTELFRLDSEGRVEALLRSPLQQAFRLQVALPLGAWRRDAAGEVMYIRRDRLLRGVPVATAADARRAG